MSDGAMFQREWLEDAQRYVWTSECGSMRAGRNVGKPTYWSMARGQVVGKEFASLKTAMLQAGIATRQLQAAGDA